MGSVAVANLGKAYKQYPHRWGRLLEWMWPWGGKRHQLHWVLKDISFSIQPGEAVGIVGINGAGKSTLLKMLTGTLRPTCGAVQLQGNVAAMLELGMGFHPDFTGRQNVVMAGQLLGFSAFELNGLMPSIIDFAEIGDYIDQPVRVYSSGMQMRLAFSVATAKRPDILIVDEALSVGDAYFQHKSFERIRAYRQQGTTLLLVSHDKQAIQSICDRVILLDAGTLATEGDPESVMDYYNALLADHQNQKVSRILTEEGKTQTQSGTGEAGVIAIALLDTEGSVVEVVDVGQSVCLQVDIEVRSFIPRLVFGYAIKDRLGQVIYGINTDLKALPLHDVEAGQRYRYEATFPANLGPGSYSVVTALTSSETHLINNYEWRDLALIFTVVNMNKPFFEGSCWIDSTISTEKL